MVKFVDLAEFSGWAKRMRLFEEALARWDTIPGVDRRVAEDLLAEIGMAMSRFASARHLAS